MTTSGTTSAKSRFTRRCCPAQALPAVSYENAQLMRIWEVMDECIRTGVSTTEKVLPGRLGLRRRAPMLYQKLMRGFYPGVASRNGFPPIGPGNSALTGVINAPDVEEEKIKLSQISNGNGNNGAEPTPFQKAKRARAPRVVGSFEHPVLPMPPVCPNISWRHIPRANPLQKRTVFPNIDFLSCSAIAVNEVCITFGFLPVTGLPHRSTLQADEWLHRPQTVRRALFR